MDVGSCIRHVCRWIRDGLLSGSLVLLTDSLHRPKTDPMVSAVGWVIACTSATRHVKGSFYKRSSSVSSYWGELAGLTAIHTLILASWWYNSLPKSHGQIVCNSKSALNRSSTTARRVRASSPQADIFQTLRLIRSKLPTTHLQYEWIKAHVDWTIPWAQMTFAQQLNTMCNKLANCAVIRACSNKGNEK